MFIVQMSLYSSIQSSSSPTKPDKSANPRSSFSFKYPSPSASSTEKIALTSNARAPGPPEKAFASPCNSSEPPASDDVGNAGQTSLRTSGGSAAAASVIASRCSVIISGSFVSSSTALAASNAPHSLSKSITIKRMSWCCWYDWKGPASSEPLISNNRRFTSHSFIAISRNGRSSCSTRLIALTGHPAIADSTFSSLSPYCKATRALPSPASISNVEEAVSTHLKHPWQTVWSTKIPFCSGSLSPVGHLLLRDVALPPHIRNKSSYLPRSSLSINVVYASVTMRCKSAAFSPTLSPRMSGCTSLTTRRCAFLIALRSDVYLGRPSKP
mmetsp:Transcript_73387/g.203764  ORF Transcript_73387/g.203764 Transcript_73387/m.203764 type:complete len:327 (-) Transcript_73387:460-1440(-)